jgi:hypothetical protein
MCTPDPDQCGGTGGCEGATSELAFEYVTNNGGLLQEFQYPYTSYYGAYCTGLDCSGCGQQPFALFFVWHAVVCFFCGKQFFIPPPPPPSNKTCCMYCCTLANIASSFRFCSIFLLLILFPLLFFPGTVGTDFECTMPPSQKPVATINGYVQLPSNDYASLMNAVATVGPVAIAVDASNWHSYSSGIYDGCNQVNPDIDHGVVLVGYGSENGQDYWLVRNSWSPTYGEQGYIRVARAANEQEKCGMDITPQDGLACNGDDTPVTVCGTCGMLFDGSYPLNAQAL